MAPRNRTGVRFQVFDCCTAVVRVVPTRALLALLELQIRFVGKPIKLEVMYPQKMDCSADG